MHEALVRVTTRPFTTDQFPANIEPVVRSTKKELSLI